MPSSSRPKNQRQHKADMVTELLESVSDSFDSNLHIQEAFDYSTSLGLDRGNGSRTDRARHMKWMVENSKEWGPIAARALGWAHEGTGLFDAAIDHVTGKRPWSESWEETKRDLQTNDFALDYQPNDMQIEGIVKQLRTEGHGAEAPDPLNLYLDQQQRGTPKKDFE